MKPSSGNHQLGWSRGNVPRAQGGQDKNSSTTETGLDARDHIHLLSEGMGRIFFLTSPLIGSLADFSIPARCSRLLQSTAKLFYPFSEWPPSSESELLPEICGREASTS